MDFKFRLQQSANNNRNTFGAPSKETTNIQNQNTTGWDKYARKTSPSPIQPNSGIGLPSRPDPTSKLSTQTQNMKTSINKTNVDRYYRSDIAPKNQFKHYLSDGNNVFFEERQSLKLIRTYKNIKWVSGIAFILLLLLFALLHFIKPFLKECPPRAECGVFVHCPNGFQYNQQNNQCVLSEQLYQEIEVVCVDMIEKAKYDWANQQCNNQQSNNQQNYIPFINLSDIVSGIQDRALKNNLVDRLEKFLVNPQDQQQHGFQYVYSSKTILPTQKKYSLLCRAKLLVHSHNFKLGIPVTLILIVLLVVLFASLRRKIIAKKIYKQLRKRTELEKQKLLNISYAKPDLEKVYGPIDEKMWELVDQFRSKDRDIGFLQDDFLYWKML